MNFERWWDKYLCNVGPIEDLMRGTLEEVWNYKQGEIDELNAIIDAILKADDMHKWYIDGKDFEGSPLWNAINAAFVYRAEHV